MEIAIAIAHFVGAFVSTTVLGSIALLFDAWQLQRKKAQHLQNLSFEIGVAVDDLDDDKWAPQILKISGERFSSELLRNRISDFCGSIVKIWGWFGWLIQICILAGVAWETATVDLDKAVFAWSVVVVWLGFWIVAILFSSLCKLLTGRYPGQSKAARKNLAELINSEPA